MNSFSNRNHYNCNQAPIRYHRPTVSAVNSQQNCNEINMTFSSNPIYSSSLEKSTQFTKYENPHDNND